MTIDRDQIDAVLHGIIDPNTEQPVTASKGVRNIKINGDTLSLEVVLSYPAKSQYLLIETHIKQALCAIRGLVHLRVGVSHQIRAHVVQRGIQLLPNVRNIIAVASGKGGVGKSTTAANLAIALANEGASVGVLDADIYGPSQPTIFGIVGRPVSGDGKTMIPLEGYGVQVNSIGFLVERDDPIMWRGPMATSALEQLLRQTNWRNLDYLIIDMPPGTGDIQLTLSNRVPLTGAVIVTTPQDIALMDVRKSLKMFEKVGVPILGVIENMSAYICSQCGHAASIFGDSGGKHLCKQYSIPFLGSLPLDLEIREYTDTGYPIMVANPHGRISNLYRDISQQVAIRIAALPRDMSAKFSTIVVQNT
ncbi:iron-sulfur cluster carrier protein ApbC [Candidatus Vallotia tarda]|uniref:Iron-sulfur cluster carrier protein n=1 Tax=Candidatus Vallotiella hemipterorum TaxID=1177213 RepID=A0A916JSQ5_9BURK|nr:iron-sulfur cluster carrier protein ApbC [Candidatus Vallotia tarda]CAG7600603.1 iron-sulfur cluster carrier protein ApbC [Candidatus Vallotia tarda]